MPTTTTTTTPTIQDATVRSLGQHMTNVWMKKCVEYKVEGARARGRPKKSWREIVEKDCQACKLNGGMP